MPFAHSDQTIRRAFHALDNGETVAGTARKLNITRKTIYVWKENRKEIEARIKATPVRERVTDSGLPPPLFRGEMSREAERALDDFGFWRHRYLGRRSVNWQEEAALNTVEWLFAPHTEFVVVNCPPGSGKSTLFTHDIPAWMICRDRTIRILLGHRVSRESQRYTAALRRTLERTRLLPAGPHNEAGSGVLAEDYGRFKPTYNDAWRNDEFMVMMSIDEDTPDESGLTNKEPTVASYGMDSEFLGTRANLVVWDDLITDQMLRSEQQIINQRQWWQNSGQTRVEPGGCLILEGQRMGSDDLYRFALEQTLKHSSGESRSRYRHVIFPAHDDMNCRGEHGVEPDDPGELSPTPVEQIPSYPEGCLLDPVRLPWWGTNGLYAIKENTPAEFEILYQQRDIAKSQILIPEIWIEGGKDIDGIDHPGCWDTYRSVGVLPRGLSKPWASVISVDPSATNWWAIGWWIIHPASNQKFLIDLHHDSMAGPDLLDWNQNEGVYYGLLHEWAIRAQQVGAPISHLIVEANACQRWLLQTDASRNWARKFQVQVLPHTTTASNKLDPLLGIQSIRDQFRYGNIRLPGKREDGSREIVRPLVTEATRYEPARPKARADDCLMMTWFMCFHAPRLVKLDVNDRVVRLERPSWAAA